MNLVRYLRLTFWGKLFDFNFIYLILFASYTKDIHYSCYTKIVNDYTITIDRDESK